MDDSHGQGNDVDLDLRSVIVSISGSASFVLPELNTIARVANVAVPLSVRLTIAPRIANFTLVASGDVAATLLGGLPLAPAVTDTNVPRAALDFGVSVTVEAHDNYAAMTHLPWPCAASAAIGVGVWWSPTEGLTFGPASAALGLACGVCVDSTAATGMQCTDSAPLLSWSLLRPAPVLAPMGAWSAYTSPLEDGVAQQGPSAPTVASRHRYRVATATASWRVRMAQTDGSDMLVWSDVDSASSESALYWAYRPRAAAWPSTPPVAIASSQGSLVQHTLAALASSGSFVVVAVSASGLVQTTFDAATLTWSTLTPVFTSGAPGDAIDSAPELSSDGRALVFTRRSEAAGYTQLLWAERSGEAKWRVPKTVVFDASRVASYAFALSVSGKARLTAMLAYQSFGSSRLSLCTLTSDTWHCAATARPASRPAIAHNGINFVLLYTSAGSLVAERLADDGSVISSSSAPIAPSACTTAEAIDLTAVRSTTAGGHSVLASWRVNSTFYVGVVSSDGRVSVTERRVTLSTAPKPTASAVAWTSSGLVAAVAAGEAAGAWVGVHVLPYTAKLALRGVAVASSADFGALGAGTNVTVTFSNVGAATFDATDAQADDEVRLAARDGVTDEYTDLGSVPLAGRIPSGATVNASVLLDASVVAGLSGALTANVGASSVGSVSAPLCQVSLTGAHVAAVATGLAARATLSARGRCNMRVHVTAWSAVGGAAASRLGGAWASLTADFNSTVSVWLSQEAWPPAGALVELRACTDDAGAPFVHDTVLLRAPIDVGTAPYDFRVLGAGIATSVDYATATSDGLVQVTVTVPLQNLGARTAHNVTVDAQTLQAGGWRTVARTSVASGALGGKSRATLTLTVALGGAAQQVRFGVNGDGRYAESLWYDNVATRLVAAPALATQQPATPAPHPSPASPATHLRAPLSTMALVGVSVAGAVVGALIGAAVYIVWRRRTANVPPKTLGTYVNMQ